MSKFEPAVREAVEKVQQDPLQLGMVLQAHNQYAEAIAAYRRAPASPERDYYLGTALAADGKYSEAIEPLRRSGNRLRLADALLAAGDPAAAAAEYRALPGVAQAHYGLGRTLTADAAAAEYVKALALFPRYGAAQFALASHYRRTGRTKEADKLLTNYERDKTVVPPVEDPLMERIYALDVSSTGLIRQARILDREGQTAEAVALHEQIVARDPKMEQAWVNLISLYARTNQPAKAEQAYQRSLALAPNRADVYYNYGVFCFGAERIDDAGRAFRKAFELDPQNPEAAHNLGAVVEMSGHLDQAAALFRKAVALKPDHRLAHFHLGRIYANRRQYPQAIAEFDQIIEPLDDQSPTYLYALAATHARAGHRSQAIALLNRARTEASARGQQQLIASIDRDLAKL